MTRVLVVDDEPQIRRALRTSLEAHGYDVATVGTGGEGVVASAEGAPDLVLLDLGLPDLDGVEVCRRLRAQRPDLTIVIVTARGEEMDVVAGLDAGADDYLVKPFRLSELLARVRAHLRRATTANAGPLHAGGVTVDRAARRAWLRGAELSLRPKEFDLLALLVAEAGRAVARERIMSEVWDTNWFGSTKTLDMHVLSLRQKLGPQAITTLRGVGYRFEAQ